MPNYLYRCSKCQIVYDLALPISHDPELLYKCQKDCSGNCKRIMRAYGAVKGFKVFAGDWFKKKYGHDVGKAYEDKARQAEDKKVMERELKRQLGHD